MASSDDSVEFTFTWMALKLLGSGLYSNPWNALSELVANGLDAQASHVYVSVDIRNISSAVVEVIDNGTGMSLEQIYKYVEVGRDRRREASQSERDSAPEPKGRKGIGKLAALYLSDNFYLTTRTTMGESAWNFDAEFAKKHPNDRPSLRPAQKLPSTPSEDVWKKCPTGTRLIMTSVNLEGYGEEAFKAFGRNLANQFVFDDDGQQRIQLRIIRNDRDLKEPFLPAVKEIAFGNFSSIRVLPGGQGQLPEEVLRGDQAVAVPAPSLEGQTFVVKQRVIEIRQPELDPEIVRSVGPALDVDSRTYGGVPYVLSGWIGVHSTISKRDAHRNDSRFAKNRYYNPSQIRLYVRGKLASDRLLHQLGLTATYLNYIEGEIRFDILDADKLPDISTANRQDFDETDGRITMLKALVRPIVRELINDRDDVARKISEQRANVLKRGKAEFAAQLHADLEKVETLSVDTRNDLETVIVNRIQGDVEAKTKYRVFISHQRNDAVIATIIDELLQLHGAHPSEIFYTSRRGAPEAAYSLDALGRIVHDNIVDNNTLPFYLTSDHFLNSQYTLFEAGAGWATRPASEYLRLAIDYKSIPDWMNSKSLVIAVASNWCDSGELTPELHDYLVRGVLNPMVDHLNRGRRANGEELVQSFEFKGRPSDLTLRELGQSYSDYFDADVLRVWSVYATEVGAYMDAYRSDNN